jgi:transposase-like protein
MPKQYPTEFRRRVLALLEAGRKPAEIAEDLEISINTVYNWRNQELIDTSQRPGASSTDLAELNAARREVAQLKQENEILRRANELMRDVAPPKDGSR